jgi:hypothetical protein
MKMKGRREIGFNFRVGLLFNSGGFISIRIGLILNKYTMSYHSCKCKKKKKKKKPPQLKFVMSSIWKDQWCMILKR